MSFFFLHINSLNCRRGEQRGGVCVRARARACVRGANGEPWRGKGQAPVQEADCEHACSSTPASPIRRDWSTSRARLSPRRASSSSRRRRTGPRAMRPSAGAVSADLGRRPILLPRRAKRPAERGECARRLISLMSPTSPTPPTSPSRGAAVAARAPCSPQSRPRPNTMVS